MTVKKKNETTDVDAVEEQAILSNIWKALAQLKVTFIAPLSLAEFFRGKNKSGLTPVASNPGTQFAQTGWNSTGNAEPFPSLGTSNKAGWKAKSFTRMLLLGTDEKWTGGDRMKMALDALTFKLALSRLQMIAATGLAQIPDNMLLEHLEKITSDTNAAKAFLTWIHATTAFLEATTEASETVTVQDAGSMSWAQISKQLAQ